MATTDPARSALSPSPSAAAPDADVESLEQEREFLLRSLADLDAEFEAGDIEEDDYRSLTDDYTARTAAVLKAIQAVSGPRTRRPGAPRSGSASPGSASSGSIPAGRPRSRPAAAAVSGSSRVPASSPAVAAALRRRRRWRRALIAGGVVVFGGITAWAVTQSTAKRQADQTITGNAQIPTTTGPAGGVDPRIAEANTDINKGDVQDALELYQAILQEDPNQPVALANSGWLEAEAGVAGKQTTLIDDGLARIVQAEKIDPTYADEHFFRGYLLLQAKNDAPDAVTEFQEYLGLADPGDPNIPQAQTYLQEAIKLAGPRVPPGANAATTTTTPTTTSKP